MGFTIVPRIRMRRELPALLLLVALTVAAFGRVAFHDFVNYDDNDCATATPHRAARFDHAIELPVTTFSGTTLQKPPSLLLL